MNTHCLDKSLIFPILLAMSLVVLPSFALSQTPLNYCLDDKTNNTWAIMLQQSPNDHLVIRLFSLRIGLCELVSRKLISLEQASELFEQERKKAIYERDPLGIHLKPKGSSS